MSIDFKSINEFLLNRSTECLNTWLPGGRLFGAEYKCANLSGGRGDSLSINVDRGVWKDFATGDSGADLISLYASINNISQGDAAKALIALYDLSLKPVKPTSKAMSWVYRDEKGNPIYKINRATNKEGKKFFWPSLLVDGEWIKKQPAVPRPLYNLDKLAAHPDKPVMIVEGEKAAEAATSFSPSYIVTTWPMGSSNADKADWSVLKGRSVLIWPDNDMPGMKAAHVIASKLKGVAKEVALLDTSKTDLPQGWDAADSGFKNQAQLIKWAKPLKVVLNEPSEPAQTNSPIENAIACGFVGKEVSDAGKLKRTLYCDEMALYFRHKLNVVVHAGNFYKYNDGYFQAVADTHIARKIMSLKKSNRFNKNDVAEFVNAIRIECFIDDLPENTNSLLNLKNGVLNVLTGELLPHSPDYFFQYKVGVDYDVTAECPNWLKFLDFIFEGDQEIADACSQMFGYCLEGGRPWLEKAFALYGEGRNGKSTLLNILRALVGDENTCSIPFESMNNEFMMHSISGKMVNILNEVDHSSNKSSAAFKTFVAGEPMFASAKYKDGYMIKPTARIVCAMNQLPVFKDATTGNYSKFIFIPFNKFIGEDERDPDMAQKLLKELPGILNWSILGLSKLKENGRFPDLPKFKEILDEYREDIDSVYSFFKETFRESHLSVVDSKFYPGAAYEDYKEWCKASGRHPKAKNSFSKSIIKFMQDALLSGKKLEKGVTDGRTWVENHFLYDPNRSINQHFPGLNH